MKNYLIFIYEYLYVGIVCGANDGGTIVGVTIVGCSVIATRYRKVGTPGNEVKVQVGGIAGNIMAGEIKNSCIFVDKSDMENMRVMLMLTLEV